MRDLLPVCFLLLSGLLITSCLKDECNETQTFVEFQPVYRSQAQLNQPVEIQEPRPLQRPGIIYYYDHYLLINELQKGIHIFDNSDPSNPVNQGFLHIDGNEHFAIVDNHLQANKWDALLTLDISSIQQPVEKSKIANAFYDTWEEPGRGFLVGYRPTDQLRTIDCSDPNFNSLRWGNNTGGGFFIRQDVAFDALSFAPDQNGNVGTGGSTARFTISHQHLYLVSDYDLKVYDLEDPSRPVSRNQVNLGWGIETIYPFKDKLFIGSTAGMFVYDVTQPSSPYLLSTFDHARACDPVVADDNTAYVTLRDGTECEGFNNQLDVIDITEVTAPNLLATYAMENPRGLALQGEYLYICEGEYGLKVMDVADREAVRELDHHEQIKAEDVIALPNGLLLVIGTEGMRQFDASDPRNLQLISHIPVQNQS